MEVHSGVYTAKTKTTWWLEQLHGVAHLGDNTITYDVQKTA